MKKIFFAFATLFAIVSTEVAVAQENDPDALVIVRHYEAITGLDKITPQMMQAMSMEADASISNMLMEIEAVMKQPGQYRINARMGDEKMLVVINGSQGWMRMDGVGIIEIPEEIMEPMRNQANISKNYRWSESDYIFELGEKTVSDEGGQWQAVKLTPRVPVKYVDSMIVYFNQETGYADRMITQVNTTEEETGAIETRVDIKDYMHYGEVMVPSRYEMYANGVAVGSVRVKKLQYGVKAPDKLFEKPKEK